MPRRIFVFLVLLCILPAGYVAAQAAGAFTRMGFGARGVAMGNALAGDDSGLGSPYYNPALAPFITQQSLDISAAIMTLGRELQFLQYATPLRPRAGIAAGVIHAGVRDIDGRDGSGYHTRNLSTDEYGFFLAFGVRTIKSVTVGVGLQLFYANLHDSVAPVTSIGIDVGMRVRVTGALSVGIVADDLLARYSWESSASSGRSSSDRFPTRLRIGATHRLLSSKLLLAAEFESRFSSVEVRQRSVEIIGGTPREVETSTRLVWRESRARLGAEYRPLDMFTVRGGATQLAGGIAPSAGFMFEQVVGALRIRAEYGVVLEPHALGAMHLVTLRFFL